MLISEFINLIQSLPFRNLDLLTVGSTIAAIGILGFLVYINDKESVSNRTFFAFALLTAFWSCFNYISYKSSDILLILWLQRIVIFLGVWHSFIFLRLTYVFPQVTSKIPFWLRRVAPLIATIVSIITLTPLVFSGLFAIGKNGNVSIPQPGPGIIIFLITSLGFILGGIVILVRKTILAKQADKRPYLLMTIGAIIMFTLIVLYNIILPAVFLDVYFIPLGALFIFPFILFTTYIIYRHKLFNVKNVITAVLTFSLCFISFLEIIFAENFTQLMLRVCIFLLSIVISIQLVKNTFQLEEANKERSEFMTFASHEIRNPITAMRGYASMILDGTMGQPLPLVQDAAEKILVNGNTVLSLISEFLSKSKIELGQIAYTITDFDVDEIVSSVADGFKAQAQQKGLLLSRHIDFHGLKARGDDTKLREILGNLIDNSIKYTKSGSVVVLLEKRNGKARITVQDTGVGIPHETIEHLFRKFSRADAQKMNLRGTGLGLFLAKTLIEGMGGTIWAESEGPDRGSRFIIELPAV